MNREVEILCQSIIESLEWGEDWSTNFKDQTRFHLLQSRRYDMVIYFELNDPLEIQITDRSDPSNRLGLEGCFSEPQKQRIHEAVVRRYNGETQPADGRSKLERDIDEVQRHIKRFENPKTFFHHKYTEQPWLINSI